MTKFNAERFLEDLRRHREELKRDRKRTVDRLRDIDIEIKRTEAGIETLKGEL